MTVESTKNFLNSVQNDEMMSIEPYQEILVDRDEQNQSNLDDTVHDSAIMNFIEDIQHHNNGQDCFLNDIDSMLS